MLKNGPQFTSAPILFVTEKKKMKEFAQPYKRAWAIGSPYSEVHRVLNVFVHSCQPPTVIRGRVFLCIPSTVNRDL